MDGFDITDHPAEIGFKAYGDTIDEAFANSGRALFAVMVDLDALSVERELTFDLTASSREALLYDFLDHLLYLRDTENLLFSTFDVGINRESDGYSITATAGGCDADGIPAQDVKAPTYSDMAIEEADGGVTIQVVLDV